MTSAPASEIWGGIECTINRVGDRTRSQLERNGHLHRIQSDLDAFASLGLSALRYPVLWEQVEQPSGDRDFARSDEALSHLRRGTMRPIVGLLHHGSGPVTTSLSDSGLPSRFAEFARDVAGRYPWVQDYTPINEPLTTARFSGLYGHWYPHAKDDRAFVRMLLNQLRATVSAMRAIRDVNPAARLVQTEDLGRATGTAEVAGQVRFENDRRWLTFDLLCGRVLPGHPMHEYLTGLGGAAASDIEWFAENPCPPDVLGINHYPRSNRWLDHRLGLHPAASRGGNAEQSYADVGACDFGLAPPPSVSSLLEETWQRYRIPVALTEIHVPGEPAARIAWWSNALDAAAHASARGAEVRAVTTWSLLGSFDWDTLCTTGHDGITYEPGAFDVSSGARVETPLAAAIRQSASRRDPQLHLHGMQEWRNPLQPSRGLSNAGLPGGAL